jgi:hypothetical protein
MSFTVVLINMYPALIFLVFRLQHTASINRHDGLSSCTYCTESRRLMIGDPELSSKVILY